MSFSGFRFRRSVVHGAVAGLGLVLVIGSGRVQAEQKSAPAGDVSGSAASGDGSDNISPRRRINLPDRPRTMNELFGNRSSHSASVPAPPPAPAVRRTKTLLDDQSNWGFVTPEDVVQDYMAKEILRMPEYGADGQEKTPMSPVERYYDRQMRGRIDAGNVQRNSQTFSVDNLYHQAGTRSPAENLAQYGINPNVLSGAAPDFSENRTRPEALSGLLGFRNNPLASDLIKEQEANQRQMDAFRRALDFQPPTGAPNLPNPTAGVPERSRGWDNTSPILNPAMARDPFDSVGGTYNSALATAAPAAPSAPAAPEAPGRQYTTPTVAPRLAPPKPDFSLPQRRF